MKSNPISIQHKTSNYESRLVKPNPPTEEMVKRAQPFRSDTLQPLEAVIKYPVTEVYE